MQARVMGRCTRIGQLLHSSVSDPSTLPDDDYEFDIRAGLGKDPFRWANVPSILASRPELYMLLGANGSDDPVRCSDLDISVRAKGPAWRVEGNDLG
jgi:hypothetical protein